MVPKAVLGAVVVVTSHRANRFYISKPRLFSFFLLLVAAITQQNFAAVLPEDRLDILYHAFDGGGADISGPSILVRKEFANTISVYGNYYVDHVNSASIDVIAQGSPYEEERTEYSVGMDYLHDKTIVSLGYTSSVESDYEAETYSFGISQDFFGDLTTISLGFSTGNDIVGRNINQNPGIPTLPGDVFDPDAKHRRYSLGISQIITKNLIMSMGFESVADEGFLNNPYRSVRFTDPTVGLGYSWEPEFYPSTHNSDAFAIRAMYYLPYRASIRAEFRSYSDNWGIESTMGELRYIHPIAKWGLTLEGKYRVYDQTGATFFNDLFPFENFTGEEFRARDKELDAFSDTGVGIGISYELPNNWLPFFDKSAVSLYWDYIQLDYTSFRDVTDPNVVVAGSEVPYSFDANVIRFFVSFWY